MQQSYQTFGPAQGSIREAIYAWQWALVTVRASQEAARYAAVVAIVKHRWRGAWLLTPILLASVGPGLFVALWAACSQVGNCL